VSAAAKDGAAATGPQGRILVLEGDPRARAAIRSLLAGCGYDAEVLASPLKALSLLGERAPHVVLTDVRMPGMNGIQFLREVRRRRPETAVLVMTGFACVSDAVRAVKLGAETYLEKPIDVPLLLALIERAVAKGRHLEELKRQRGMPESSKAFSRILGAHPAVAALRQLVQRVAGTDATVLLVGETGAGKGLAAAAVHELSRRAARPFVKLNCAALAESILEAELFGDERGASTGGLGRREGRLEQADGGTLLLDEVSELPLRTQVKLLRFLQDREFERVGGNETLRVDVRLLAATHQDLGALVKAGRFREDLFCRLDIARIDLPPLRERSTDIPVLAAAMLARFARLHGKEIEGFSGEALERLCEHGWPGNVRELESAVERAVVMAGERWIPSSDLEPALREAPAGTREARIPGSTLADIEREAILRTLEAVRGSTSKAAAVLGISQRKIQYRLREYAAG
jgi:DNA-binding NtrC family response regulator